MPLTDIHSIRRNLKGRSGVPHDKGPSRRRRIKLPTTPAHGECVRSSPLHISDTHSKENIGPDYARVIPRPPIRPLEPSVVR